MALPVDPNIATHESAMGGFFYYACQLAGAAGFVLSVILWRSNSIRVQVSILEFEASNSREANQYRVRIINLSHKQTVRIFRIHLEGQKPEESTWEPMAEPEILVWCFTDAPHLVPPRARIEGGFFPLGTDDASKSYKWIRVSVEAEDGIFYRSPQKRLFGASRKKT